jgi:hypothetical protein
MEKLDSMHRNSVQRELVTRPKDRTWSSAPYFAPYDATGEEGSVGIKVCWAARRREWVGVCPVVRAGTSAKSPALSPRTREGQGTRLFVC